jgi:uncharacterized protein (DUF433 family)
MIITNPNIQGGLPVIKGTRITVLEVLQALQNNFSFEDIIERSDYAGIKLNKTQIKEAIKYACNILSK